MRTIRVAILALAAALAAGGCKARDADLIALACQKAGRKLGLGRGSTAGTLAEALRGTLGEASLAARVENRIRWDRALADQPVEVTASGTAVTLRGELADASLRQRAMDLAKATLGVDRVVDELTVAEEGQ